jgi:hypothetical protein
MKSDRAICINLEQNKTKDRMLLLVDHDIEELESKKCLNNTTYAIAPI